MATSASWIRGGRGHGALDFTRGELGAQALPWNHLFGRSNHGTGFRIERDRVPTVQDVLWRQEIESGNQRFQPRPKGLLAMHDRCRQPPTQFLQKLPTPCHDIGWPHEQEAMALVLEAIDAIFEASLSDAQKVGLDLI